MQCRRVRRVVAALFLSAALFSGAVMSASLGAPRLTEAVPAAKQPLNLHRVDRSSRDLPRSGQDQDPGLVDILQTSSAQPGGDHEDTTVLNKPDVVRQVVLARILLPRGRLLTMPVQGPITSGFGMRFHPVLHLTKLHTGTDFGVPCGTPVGASAPGTVTSAGWAGGYGVQVVIDHGTIAGHQVRTTYNHLSSLGVSPGQKVKTGDGIGLVGNTGYSTGCHLHFEVIADGQFTDPVPWLSGTPVIVDLSRMRTVVLGQPAGTSSPTGTASPAQVVSSPTQGSSSTSRPSPVTTPEPSPSTGPSACPTPTPSMPPSSTPTPGAAPSGCASPSSPPSSSPTPPSSTPLPSSEPHKPSPSTTPASLSSRPGSGQPASTPPSSSTAASTPSPGSPDSATSSSSSRK